MQPTGDNDYIRFATDDERSELRIPKADEWSGSTSRAEKLFGTVRLPATDPTVVGVDEDTERYTFMQVLPPLPSPNYQNLSAPSLRCMFKAVCWA